MLLVAYCSTAVQVLAMLVDLQLAAITSRPLGSHTAHMTWQNTTGSPQLSAMPEVPVTLRQVRCVFSRSFTLFGGEFASMRFVSAVPEVAYCSS
jgi:hypothetical protein